MAVNAATSRGRLVAWLVYIGAFATLQYIAYFTGGESTRVPKDYLYRYSSAVYGVLQFGIMLGLALLIAVGAPKRELFALRRPRSWGVAVGIGIAVLVVVYTLSGILSLYLDPGREQGLLPSRWRPERAGQYAANFLVVAVLVPIVEELIFRGLGFALLRRYGETAAVVLVGVLFAAAHGLVEAFPIIAAFGIGLALLRSRTESVYPGMILHGTFNAIAMLAVFS